MFACNLQLTALRVVIHFQQLCPNSIAVLLPSGLVARFVVAQYVLGVSCTLLGLMCLSLLTVGPDTSLLTVAQIRDL